MIIEDPESFKTWLTAKLEPLCDADPAALAKYVYALVKKDKPVEELRTSMLEQLEVFLQRETQGFVNLLFKTLETQVFDSTADVQAHLSPPPVTKTTVDVDLRDPLPISNSHDESEKKTTKEPNAAILASAQNSNSLGCVLLATATGRREQTDRHIRKTDSDKEDRSRRVRRRGSSASPGDRRRSRSRSFDRRRSRSRERDRARAWRNKSPPPSRRYERRRSYSKSPVRRYSKSRSPQSKRIRYRNRSPPRSRSRSPLDSRERKDVAAGISPRDTSHGDLDLRLPPPAQNIQSVVAVPPEMQNFSNARRCRDFDEKGFCMRGDLCPYDHGTDPVILEDVNVPIYNGGPTPQAPIMSQPPPPNLTGSLRHPAASHPPIRPPPPPPPPVPLVEYNPDAPSMEPRMWSRPPQFRGGLIARGMARGGLGRGNFPPHQRELINVVTGPHFRHQRPSINVNSEINNVRMGANDGTKGSGFNAPQRLPFTQKGGNTSLQLKKVPQGANNITHLNNHFSKFGKIVNIQVGFEGDPESALITFSSHTEANIAYKSTEAVLNNRFIRVYWYNPTSNNSNSNENKQENSTIPTTRPSALDRLGAPPTKVLNNIQPSAVQQAEKVTLVNNNLSKTLYIPSAMKKETIAQALSVENKEQINEELKKKLEEVSVAKKKQEEARKAGIKLNADLRKRKQELLDKQLNQQKLLIQRMETSNITQQQKSTLMATIKTLQESIEKIQKDLEHSVKANLTKVSKRSTTKEHLDLVKKTREEVQRELLDAELDLINRQHEGKDADDLKKKVADLKLKAYSLGISSVRGSYRGRGTLRVRGRGRGAKFLSSMSYDHNVVDHRPTKVLVSGYEQDDKADVLTHFEQYGAIVDYISDDATPSLVLNYKSRKEAEQAITKGKNFHDRVLSVTWATHNNNIRGGIPTKPTTPILRSVMVMEEDEIGEDILEGEDEEEFVGVLSPDFLLNEDEEDEDEEDRTWRR
ncbi:zinc finger protein swm isoform X3 [Rhodnius prolixus]|uniref:Putative rna-binding protein 26 n=1 Tax=Rhodnius neglectus TaxID=72488 RepID=A0A0P4W0Y2_9HEMI